MRKTDLQTVSHTGEDAQVLAVSGLKTWFDTPAGVAKAVDGVDFTVAAGQTLGVVGESGCGKSVSALSIMRLIPIPPGRFSGGEIRFFGTNLLDLSNKEMRKIRGCRISMIFQEPMTSLNPVFTVGDQIVEALRLHQGLSRKAAWARAVEMLAGVGIASPARRIREYPHEMSGGMRQRVMIAMALSCNPALLIADEPTTALDVTIQAQILELIDDLKSTLRTAVLFITHDLGVIAETAETVIVMYAGKVVEQADVKALFASPLHPYTRGLMGSIPRESAIRNRSRLTEITGIVPSLTAIPSGCSFHPRCPECMPVCKETPPRLLAHYENQNHYTACWLYEV